MTRINATISPADETLFREEQQSLSAIAASRALQDGKNTSYADERLADMKAGADKLSEKADKGSVHVDLSGAGKAMAAGGQAGWVNQNENADIDDSDLPDQVKDLLKRIRQIREELSQKQAELREAMADTRMRPEQRKMKVAMLQAEVMALSSALVLASKTLNKLITEMKLSPEQAMTAGQLMMA